MVARQATQKPTSQRQLMFLDERLLGANSTAVSRDEWGRDCWPQVELIWSFMIVLHLCALLHIDPLVLHILSVVLKLVTDTATPVVNLLEYCADEAFTSQV